MKKILLLITLLLTNTSHAALTKVPSQMAGSGVLINNGSTSPLTRKTGVATCTTTSSIINQGFGASWMSAISNMSSGNCDITLTGGFFASSFLCSIVPRGGSTSAAFTWKIAEISSTQVRIYCVTSASNPCTTGEPVNVFCEGY